MIPWKHIASAKVPDGSELGLYQRDAEFSIRADGKELMNSRQQRSEQVLAELACARVGQRPSARFLIGGLGLGFTLQAACRALRKDALIEVAELIPAVVSWNEEHCGHLAEFPLKDRRVRVRVADVADIVRGARGAYDAILLDVDNGPEAFTCESNEWLYGRAGLGAIWKALRPHGGVAIWSARPSPAFSERLRRAGFFVEVVTSKARANGKGARHTIWWASKRD